MTSSEKNTAFLWSQMKSEPSKTIECIEFLFLYDAVIEIKFRLSEFYFDNGDIEKNDVDDLLERCTMTEVCQFLYFRVDWKK